MHLAKSSLHSSAIVWACAVTLLVAFSVWQSEAGTGGMGGAALRIPSGATAFAMGGAYTAQAEIGSALWNPAAIVDRSRPALSIGGGLYALNRTEANGSFAMKVPPRAGLAIALLFRGDAAIDLYGYDDYDNVIELKSGSFGSLVTKLGIGFMITRKVNVGLSIGIFNQFMPVGYKPDGSLITSTTTALGGIDVAMLCHQSSVWQWALVVHDIGATMEWHIPVAGYEGLEANVSEPVAPIVVVASSAQFLMAGSPLLWNSDCRFSLFDQTFSALEHPSLVFNNGLEWRRWESMYLRLGVGDIGIDGDMWNDTRYYWDNFSMRFCGGFRFVLPRQFRNTAIGYAISTNKIWLGVDQQVDVSVTF